MSIVDPTSRTAKLAAKVQQQAALRAVNFENAKAATAKIDDEIKQHLAQPSDSAVLALDSLRS